MKEIGMSHEDIFHYLATGALAEEHQDSVARTSSAPRRAGWTGRADCTHVERSVLLLAHPPGC